MTTMNNSLPDCYECWDGADVYKGQRCPVCGRPGKKERPESRQRRGIMRQDILRKFHSLEFQEQVRLARRTFQIPESGLSRDEAVNSLSYAGLACWTTYLWTLERFQSKILDIKGKDKREEFFRPAVGPLAPLLASLTYPDARPQSIEWLLVGKLIASRLSSWLGIDNVPEIFLYLLCSELSPPESWELQYVTERGDDPFLRQLERFVEATLPLTEKSLSKGGIRKQAEAAAYLAYQVAKGEATWEENRRAFAALFPPFSSDYSKKHQVRARRAAKGLSYGEIVKQVREFLSKGRNFDNR